MLFNLDGYTFINSDRIQSRGGGVGLLVSEMYDIKFRTDLFFSSVNYESLFIEIVQQKQKNLLVGIIYRKLQSNLREFTEEFDKCLEKMNRENKRIYIMGHFNVNIIRHTNNAVSNFLSVIYANYLLPLIDKPTRITSTTSSLIDNIFTNHLDFDVSSGLFYNDISDHFPIFQITKQKLNIQCNPLLYSRIINGETIDSFKMLLCNVNWTRIIFCSNTDEAYNSFLDYVLHLCIMKLL